MSTSTTEQQFRRLVPLSERILATIPAPRSLLVAIWAAVPWANAGANLLLEDEARSAVWEQGRALVLLNYAAVSLAIVIAVWGAARIARRLEALPGDTSGGVQITTEQFRELNSTAVPLLGAAATALAFGTSALVGDGLAAGVLRGATWFIVGAAIWSFLTVYASLNLGLDRIGRERLPAEAGLARPHARPAPAR